MWLLQDASQCGPRSVISPCWSLSSFDQCNLKLVVLHYYRSSWMLAVAPICINTVCGAVLSGASLILLCKDGKPDGPTPSRVGCPSCALPSVGVLAERSSAIGFGSNPTWVRVPSVSAGVVRIVILLQLVVAQHNSRRSRTALACY